MSHHASFKSPKVPRPMMIDPVIELGLRIFSPCTEKIGFHFGRYDWFIRTPIIRQEVRNLKFSGAVNNQGHVTVYTPGYDCGVLESLLSRVSSRAFHVFHIDVSAPYRHKNVYFYPVQSQAFLRDLAGCATFLSTAGFQGPAEAIFLGKPLIVAPQSGQYEQRLNAAALKRLGVLSLHAYTARTMERVAAFLQDPQPVAALNYPDETEKIVNRLAQRYLRKPGGKAPLPDCDLPVDRFFAAEALCRNGGSYAFMKRLYRSG
jgi:hypothetical protein